MQRLPVAIALKIIIKLIIFALDYSSGTNIVYFYAEIAAADKLTVFTQL